MKCISRPVRLCAAVLLLLILTACGPAESVNPLSDPLQAKHDEELLGTWAGRNEDDTILMHFVPAKKSFTHIVLVGRGKDGADILTYEMFPTSIGKNRYMNVRNWKPKPQAGGKKEDASGKRFFFTKYEIAEDILTIWTTKNGTIRKAIEQQKLEGEIRKGKHFTSVTITDSSGNLSRFVQSTEHEILFELFMKFKKVEIEFPLPEPKED